MKSVNTTERMTVLVMGLGLHGGGVGAANYFTSRGCKVVVTDLKTPEQLTSSLSKLQNREKVHLVLGEHRYEDFEKADLIIKNPGVPPDSPYLIYAKKKGIRVESDLGIFLDEVRETTNNIIGITGTKGKSTTASLIHKIIARRFPKAFIAGNIRVSVLDILPLVEKDDFLVLELSSFQLGSIAHKKYSPHAGVFTNFMDDHLDYYKSRDEYFEDKAVIFRFQKKGDFLIINRDDRTLNKIEPQRGVSIFSFGADERFDGDGTFLKQKFIWVRKNGDEEKIMPVEEFSLPGTHNIYNLLAACAAGCALGCMSREIREAVESFSGLEHRLEYVTDINDIRFYNDSAATTPEAAIQGVRSVPGPVTLIAGGSEKGVELKKFCDVLNREVEYLVLLEGDGTSRMLESGLKKEYSLFNNLHDAVSHALLITEPGGSVLFSPGFASFGMFMNEFHRGEEFKKIVKKIKTGRQKR